MIRFRCYFSMVVGFAIMSGSLVADAQIKVINQMTQPKLVKVYGSGGISGLHAYQSGFFVSPDGLIATTWSHVLDGETSVVTADGRKFKTEFVGMDPGLEGRVVENQIGERSLFFTQIDFKNAVYRTAMFLTEQPLWNLLLAMSNQSLMRGTVFCHHETGMRNWGNMILHILGK